jgi:hypothetical protein
MTSKHDSKYCVGIKTSKGILMPWARNSQRGSEGGLGSDCKVVVSKADNSARGL